MFQRNHSQEKLLSNNIIMVHVWLPRVHGQPSTQLAHVVQTTQNDIKGRENTTSRFGHVSIQTPTQYASWYPDITPTHGLKTVPAQRNRTFIDDYNDEEGEADLRICFYSLNVPNIEAAFKNVEKSEDGYVLVGNKKISRLFNDKKGHNCAGLVYDLLQAGDLSRLIYSYQDLTTKWLIVTPESLATLLKHAKEYELTRYPETQRFPTYPAEYVPVTAHAIQRLAPR